MVPTSIGWTFLVVVATGQVNDRRASCSCCWFQTICALCCVTKSEYDGIVPAFTWKCASSSSGTGKRLVVVAVVSVVVVGSLGMVGVVVVVVTFTVHGSGLSRSSRAIIMTLVVVDAGNTVLGSSKLVVVGPHSSSSSATPISLLWMELLPRSWMLSLLSAATTATCAPSLYSGTTRSALLASVARSSS